MATVPHHSYLRLAKLGDYLELVKFSHTIFALPFALAAMLLASHHLPGHLPDKWTIFWILVAMVSARTTAMGFNRIVDRHIDAQNPRTQNREIPAGKVSVGEAAALVNFSALVFLFAAWRLQPLALALALPALFVLCFYSYCKRFTSLAHLVLGFCLGIAPVGAWIAVRGQIEIVPVILAAAIMFWVAGFDIIYATMDVEFDKKMGLHSMVQRFGIRGALHIARGFHLLFIVLLFAFGKAAGLSDYFSYAVGLIALFLVYEHAIVNPNDLRRVNAAFFTVNGAISVFFLAVVVGEIFVWGKV
jgi:4-hydroxybenzoate polyprenyltransferase